MKSKRKYKSMKTWQFDQWLNPYNCKLVSFTF